MNGYALQQYIDDWYRTQIYIYIYINSIPHTHIYSYDQISFPRISHHILISPVPPLTCPLGTQGVPDVAVEVVIAGQEEPAGLAERHAGDAADDVVMAVDRELLVRADVEHPTGGVIRSGGEGVTVREELQRLGM